MQIDCISTTLTSHTNQLSGISMRINPTNMAVATEQTGGLGFPSNGRSQAFCTPWLAQASIQGYKVSIIEDK